MNAIAAKYKTCLAELIGTFGLVFFGTASIAMNDLNPEIVGNTEIGLIFGLIVMVMIYAFGQTSGAHINPAVTLAFWVGKEFPRRMVLPYIISQFAGAALASLSVFYLFPSATNIGSTLPHAGVFPTLIIEALLSLILMLVIFQVAKGTKEVGLLAGIAIGSTVGLEAIIFGPMTGASMNPARSFGPALLSGQWYDLWIYLVSPVAGMLFSIIIWKRLRNNV